MNELEGLIPVEGKEGLYRDPSSNAIVKKASVDEYDKYMASYNKRQKEEAEKKGFTKRGF